MQDRGLLSYNLRISFIYLTCIFMLGLGFIILGKTVRDKCREEWAKLRSFECGFDPLGRTRQPFSLRFYLLALLFLVFDVEIVLLFPYIFSLKVVILKISLIKKVACFSFVVILLLGLIHELNEGRLQ